MASFLQVGTDVKIHTHEAEDGNITEDHKSKSVKDLNKVWTIIS